MSRLRRLIETYPLTVVMIVAILARAIAVLFSKGYMASDDHFETVSVAYNWLQHGILSQEGLLRWGGHVPGEVFGAMGGTEGPVNYSAKIDLSTGQETEIPL